MDLRTQVTEKILSLKNQLEIQHPQMQVLLREIWKTLKDNPDQVTLLEEEEIQTIVAGLEKQTQITLITKAITTKTKSLKSITLDDL